MRIVVAGGRDYDNKEAFDRKLDNVMERFPEATLVSGHARGADTLAEIYAAEHNIPIKVFKADWGSFGRSAGVLRNREMLEYASLEDNPLLVAFWDGHSRGTLSTINIAYGMKIAVEVEKY